MKNLKVTVNGIEYDVKVEEIDEPNNDINPIKTNIKQEPENKSQPTAKQPLSADPSTKIPEGSTVIKAPMPGVIVSVNVNKGDTIKKGQVLLILEAMKMENEITSPVNGIVENIFTNKRGHVESGENLIVIK